MRKTFVLAVTLILVVLSGCVLLPSQMNCGDNEGCFALAITNDCHDATSRIYQTAGFIIIDIQYNLTKTSDGYCMYGAQLNMGAKPEYSYLKMPYQKCINNMTNETGFLDRDNKCTWVFGSRLVR